MMSATFGLERKCRTFGAHALTQCIHALTGVAINFRPIRACREASHLQHVWPYSMLKRPHGLIICCPYAV